MAPGRRRRTAKNLAAVVDSTSDMMGSENQTVVQPVVSDLLQERVAIVLDSESSAAQVSTVGHEAVGCNHLPVLHEQVNAIMSTSCANNKAYTSWPCETSYLYLA